MGAGNEYITEWNHEPVCGEFVANSLVFLGWLAHSPNVQILNIINDCGLFVCFMPQRSRALMFFNSPLLSLVVESSATGASEPGSIRIPHA